MKYLLNLLTLLIVSLTILNCLNLKSFAKEPGNISLSAMIIDTSYRIKPLINYRFSLHKTTESGSFIPDKVDPAPFSTIKTGSDGTAVFYLEPGSYAIRSIEPFEIGNNMYEWDYMFTVKPDENINIEFTNSNANKYDIHTSFQRKRPLLQDELFEYLKDGIVTVETDRGAETGFIIDERGLILSTYHLFEGSVETRVLFDPKTKTKAILIAADPKKDLAIILTDTDLFFNARPLTLLDTKKQNITDFINKKAVIISCPDGNIKKMIDTKILTVAPDEIITDTPIAHALTGSPVINSSGDVIGINTYVDYNTDRKKTVSKTIPISDASVLIDNAKRILIQNDMNDIELELIPTLSGTNIPEDILNKSLEKDFKFKEYVYNVDPYKLIIYTPALYYYLVKENKLEKKKINKRKVGPNAKSKLKKYTLQNINPYSPFEELNSWSEGIESVKPYIIVEVVPLLSHTDDSKARRHTSIFFGSISGLPIYLGKKSLKFKEDFYNMRFTLNGKEVEPVKRAREYNALLYSDYFRFINRQTHSGLFFFDPRILLSIDPDEYNDFVFTIYSKPKGVKPVIIELKEPTINAIYEDFKPYFDSMPITKQ
ncbi:MAG: serine protease [Cyanobacteriota bacterium]